MPSCSFLGALSVVMTKAPYNLPAIVNPDGGYMAAQFSPDVSIQYIEKLSSWWWDLATVPETQYLSMVFDDGGGPRAYTTNVYRPEVGALKTFAFTGSIGQSSLTGGESTIGIPWFDWGNVAIGLRQDGGGVTYVAVYDISVSGSPSFIVPATPLTISNDVVRWLQTSANVSAMLFPAVCNDGTQIPILITQDTVTSKLAVMPFDWAAYPGIAPTWTITAITNPISSAFNRIYVLPNVTTKTNLLVWTQNGFNSTGTVHAAPLTIDSSRVATVGALSTYAVDAGTPFPLQGQLLQVATSGALTYDTNLGTPSIGNPSSYYFIAPDLSGFKELYFSGAGAPVMPRAVSLDNNGNVWTWDFRSGDVWHGPVSGPAPSVRGKVIYEPPPPYNLPAWSPCIAVNRRTRKIRVS